MDEFIDFRLQDLEPAYQAPDEDVKSEVNFNIDYYKSHFVPVREIVELKKANPYE